jgi:hypothetical protein
MACLIAKGFENYLRSNNMFESLVTFLDNLPLTKYLSSVAFPYPVGYDFTV